MKRFSALLVLTVTFGVVACDSGHPDHDHDHGNGDHDHEQHEVSEHGHGARRELGRADVFEMSVTMAVFGAIEAGSESHLDIRVDGGDPSAIRAWIGVESGIGSVKTLLGRDGERYHGHIEVPDPIADGSRLWLVIQAKDGRRETASFEFR
ncbi:MAG: hypothetical protein CMJ18_18065 [Phycisphaeraceae bacterium]|nr:hypothetical protein [Phycisphaeraceae bacterium]